MTAVLTRRQALGRGGTLLLGTLGLAACGYGKDTSSSGSGGGGGSDNLTVALWGDADRAEIYRKALAIYHEDHSAVKASLSFADLDPYLKRLATQAAAGGLPDVFWMRDTHVARYGESNALLKLDPYLGKSIDLDDLNDTAKDDGLVDGGVYALPTHYVGQAIIRNDDVFGKHKLSWPQQPTWDDVAGLMTQVAQAEGKGYYGSNDPTLGSTQRHFEAYVRQNGAELYKQDGSLGFTADLFGDWLDFWQQLRKAAVIPAADVEVEADASNDQNLLITGKAAMLWESSNHLSTWQELTKSTLVMTSLPELADASSDWWFFPPILINAAARTKSADTAAKLIDFFLNDEAAAAITGVNQGAPSSSTIRKALIPKLSKSDAAFISQIDREMTYPRRPLPVRPKGNEEVNSAIQRTSQAVAYGKQSIGAAASALVKEAQGYL